jgi:uncharacterized membrane protein
MPEHSPTLQVTTAIVVAVISVLGVALILRQSEVAIPASSLPLAPPPLVNVLLARIILERKQIICEDVDGVVQCCVDGLAN